MNSGVTKVRAGQRAGRGERQSSGGQAPSPVPPNVHPNVPCLDRRGRLSSTGYALFALRQGRRARDRAAVATPSLAEAMMLLPAIQMITALTFSGSRRARSEDRRARPQGVLTPHRVAP